MTHKKGLWYDLYTNNIKDPVKFVLDLYDSGMSGNEIAEYLLSYYRINTTPKTITEWVKKNGKTRDKASSKRNAIKRGRMVYLKKPKHLLKKSGSLSSKIRFNVLQRDNFACTLCGNSPKTGYTLEIHHINGSSSDLDNLQTLCFQCHRGLHYTKKDKV